ncbi:MAG TPA: Asp-tRNA(Asn)/Glu-tRNA(Gln) amidotransferase subunit GatC [Gemmatimonadaceae bacterium]|nr:Asp-tRNA(Asn)/Glu-tRNA(Gln) amidotransferase subunit GatC [Gemmatimonadaceae bacterium]
MSVNVSDVLHVAKLARLGVSEERLPQLVAQLNGILEHMDVLGKVDTTGVAATEGVGAAGTPLREDGGEPVPLAHPIESFAPATRDGFLIVPRLATHDDAAEETA